MPREDARIAAARDQVEWLIQNAGRYDAAEVVNLLQRVKDNYLQPVAPKKAWADHAAAQLWKDLMGRKGLKEEGARVSRSVRMELLRTWAGIIRAAKP
ncbi:MAG: hypothetical protein INH43_03010 [Acidobacteriaceae bacterium]|nr:hypothetical protein [Acidobacteriaceae bacterium]